jgi:predicted Zn finger-like uncharacterized protein
MADSRVFCPACDARLKLTDDWPPGRKIRCPKCNAVFSVPEADEEPISEAKPARRQSAKYDEEDELERPRRRRRKRPVKEGVQPAVLVGIILACVLLGSAVLGGGFWLARTVLAPQQGADPSVAQAPPVAPPQLQGLPAQNVPPRNNNPPEPLPPQGIEIGNLAKEIESEDVDGKRLKLSDYRGKVVLLDFWGNW